MLHFAFLALPSLKATRSLYFVSYRPTAVKLHRACDIRLRFCAKKARD